MVERGMAGGVGVGDPPLGGLGALSMGNWAHIRAARNTNSSFKTHNTHIHATVIGSRKTYVLLLIKTQEYIAGKKWYMYRKTRGDNICAGIVPTAINNNFRANVEIHSVLNTF